MPIRFPVLIAAAVAAALGWYQLFAFSRTPGEQFAAPALWPQEIHQISPSSTPLLLVFVHPRCSCTSATLEQLDRLLSETHISVRLALILYHSAAVDQDATPAGLHRNSLFDPLHRPFQQISDTNGLLARRFGAATSGEVVLYAADGRLLFQGGITPERSHIGQSDSGEALVRALRTNSPQPRSFSVFGCSIFDAAVRPTLLHRGAAL